mgnify:CR=1 FL=1
MDYMNGFHWGDSSEGLNYEFINPRSCEDWTELSAGKFHRYSCQVDVIQTNQLGKQRTCEYATLMYVDNNPKLANYNIDPGTISIYDSDKTIGRYDKDLRCSNWRKVSAKVSAPAAPQEQPVKQSSSSTIPATQPEDIALKRNQLLQNYVVIFLLGVAAGAVFRRNM